MIGKVLSEFFFSHFFKKKILTSIYDLEHEDDKAQDGYVLGLG